MTRTRLLRLVCPECDHELRIEGVDGYGIPRAKCRDCDEDYIRP